MEKVLELYKYIDGVNDAKFPNDEEQVVVRDFRYDAKRMGGAPTISFSIKHSLCLDNLWDDYVYAMFNGERYYVKQTPTSSYSNEDTRYKHEVELISERTILDNVYFYDVVTIDVENDKPVSNSSKFSFFGDIHEYVKRVGYSLSWSGLDYTIEIDENIVSEEKQVSFENQVITSVLQEIYNIYQIPYYFDGKVIHVGYYQNNIDHVFKYGAQNSLLSISQTNANAKIVNRITGVGSQDNIPYYYPNDDEKGITRPLLNDSTSGVQIVSASKYRKIRLSDRFIFNQTIQAKTSLIDENNYTLGDLRIGSFKDEKSKFIVDFLYSFTLKQGENVEFSVTSSYEDNVGLSYDMYKKGGNYIGPFVDSSQMYLSSGEYSFVVRWSFMAQGTMIEIEEQLQSLIATYLNIRANLVIDAENTWTLNGIPVSLENYGLQVDSPNNGDVVSIEQTSYINPQSSLMPSIYRETLGQERFYNALNDTYVDEESGDIYSFENEYSSNQPKEHIEDFEDIKPTIKNVTNKDGYRIDRFLDFAYDLHDNDEVDENGKYIHPYFFAKLHRLDGDWGFNLFDHAIDESEMIISMTSGSCGSCSFKVLVNKETQKNTVQVDEYGNLLRDNNGNVRFGSPQDSQNDTENNEVWIALEKDIQTFGAIMPNATNNYRPSAGDTFVILHIDLPKSYIESAEKKLENELIKYMYENNFEKFNFSISFSHIFFAEQPNILANLTENSKLNVEYNGTTYELYVSSLSYAMNSSQPLPEIKVELDDVIAISQNQISQIVASTKKEILAVSNQDVFWKNIKGVPSWITNEKPQYSYNELYGRSAQEDNDIWVVKTDGNGNKYIFSIYPVVTQYGITMYADGGELDLPSIYAGLPIDGSTLIRDGNGVLMINPDIELGGGASTWDELIGKPAWIGSTKPSYNYSEILQTPDLSVYVTSTVLGETLADYVKSSVLTSELAKYVTLGGDEPISGLKDFTKGLKISGLGISKSQDDVIYIDANLVVRGGITMYAEGDVDIPSILDSLPVASTTVKGIASFDSSYFSVDSDGKVTLLAENVGLNETELFDYLSRNNYAKKSDIPSLSGYATETYVEDRLDDLINGAPAAYDTLKEIADVLQGNVNSIGDIITTLGTKADKATTLAGYGITDAYTKTKVDELLSLYVTLATSQTITGEKNFTGGLKVNGSPIVYDATNKYWKLEGDLLVTGGVTMFASDSAFTPSTIMDAIATDGTNLKVVNGVLTFVGSIEGGEAGSVAWENVKGKPSFASVATSGKYADLSGVPTLLSSFTNDLEFVSKGTTLSHYGITDAIGYSMSIIASKADVYKVAGYGTTSGGFPVNGGAIKVGQNNYQMILHGRQDVLRFNTVEAGTLQTWRKVWHDGNFNPSNYLLASSYTASDILSKLLTVDGEGSGLDADMLDGYDSSKFIRCFKKSIDINTPINDNNAPFILRIDNTSENPNTPSVYANLLHVSNTGSDTAFELLGAYSHDILFFRRGTWRADGRGTIFTNPWKTIAFTDSNVESATKLKTARTIWGQNFDGTANVSGTLTLGYNSIIGGGDEPILGQSTGGYILLGLGTSKKGFDTYIDGYNIRFRYGTDSTEGMRLTSSGNVLIGTTTNSGYKLDVNGTLGVTGVTTLKSTLSVASDTTLATKLTLNGIPIYKSQDDVLYIDGNLAVRGGITMYATDAIDVPSIIEALPSASSSVKGIAAFNPNDFSVVDGYVSFIGRGGVDESVLADYAKKTDLSNYLPLSGGQMTGGISCPIEYDGNITGLAASCVLYYDNSLTARGSIDNKRSLMGYGKNNTTGYWYNIISVRGDSSNYGMSITSSMNSNSQENLYWNRQIGSSGDWQGERVILDSYNWSQYITAGAGGNYLPLSGGTIDGRSGSYTPLNIYSNHNQGIIIYGSATETTINYNSLLHGTSWTTGINIKGEMANSYCIYSITKNENVLKFRGSDGKGFVKFGMEFENTGLTTYASNGITIGSGDAAERYITCYGKNVGYINIGKSPSKGNTGELSFHYYGDGRSSNMLQLGFYGGSSSDIRIYYNSHTQVSGNLLTTGGITMYSDIRKKTKLQDVELSLKQIADAPLIEHYYNSDAMRTTHVGSIAQYWVGLNDWFCKLDSEGFYTMEIQNAALASAISIARELVKYESKTDKEIRLLKDEVKRLKKEIKILKSA